MISLRDTAFIGIAFLILVFVYDIFFAGSELTDALRDIRPQAVEGTSTAL